MYMTVYIYLSIIYKYIYIHTSPFSSKMFQVFYSLSCFCGICVETSASIFDLALYHFTSLTHLS